MPQSTLQGMFAAALQQDGISPTSANVQDLMHIADHESTYEPGAVNPTPVGSEHATGLMQTLPSTFSEYAKSGMNDIYNPYDNAVAAINYMVKRYGSVQNAWDYWQQHSAY